MTTEINQPITKRKWYEIWWDVWRNPGVGSFQALLQDADHSTARGFIWIAVTSLIVALATSVFSVRSLQNYEPNFASPMVYYLCVVILTPIFAILGVTISTGIYHGIARLLGGRGTWSDLVICVCAVTAPSALIAGVIALITFLILQIPLAFFIPSLLSFIFGIYAIVLYIIALKASENLSSGKAVLVYFIPALIAGLIFLCSVLALVPAFRTTS